MLEDNLNGFNSLHEIIQPISINRIEDGKFKSVGVIDDLDAFAPPEK
jgi:branched-chain amino acid transport system substrate-binding protein